MRFADFWYEYEPVRHCSFDQPYCDSNYMFCDLRAWRCRSKVQLGGNCTGFSQTDICFKSFCIQVFKHPTKRDVNAKFSRVSVAFPQRREMVINEKRKNKMELFGQKP